MRGSGRMAVCSMAAALVLAAGIAAAKSHEGHGRGASARHGRDGGGERGASPGGDVPAHPGGAPCDATLLASLDADVEAACPCAGPQDATGATMPWKNHGRYVRCVAHAVRDAARAAGLKRRCVADSVPCASRSTCGKAGAVACVVVSAPACVAGACQDAAAAPCTTDADCVTSTCAITTAARCDAAGGTGAIGSCCAGSPSGAFIDGASGW